MTDAIEERILTKSGPIKGYTVKSDHGEIRAFLGIPYGEAPMGDMRFELPVPKRPWSATLDCTRFGPAAVPYQPPRRPRVFSEDCLHLNVFCPTRKRAGGYPVLFHDHPSAFCTGAPDVLTPQSLAEHFVRKGFVVVTFSFRLGVFGFASTGDEVMPGNLAIHDTVLAFNWTRANIAAFGGNPDDITPWGFSAGAMGSCFLSLIPETSRHVKKVILSSGSSLGGFGFGEMVVEATLALARAMGIDTSDSRRVKAELKKRKVDDFFAAILKSGKANRSLPFKWAPRIDGQLLTKDLPELIAEAPRVSVLAGWTTEEALFFYDNFLQNIHNMGVPKEKFQTMNREELIDRIKNLHITEQYFGKLAPKMHDDIIDFYAKDAENLRTPVQCLEREIKMMSHLYCTVPNYLEYLLRTNSGHKVFLYQNSYWREHHFSEKHPYLRGCMHIAEVRLLFDIPVPSLYDMTEEDIKVRDTYLNSVINFVNNGDPSHDQIKWPPMSAQRPFVNLHLCAQPRIQEDLGAEQKHFNFWLGMARKHGINALRTNIRLPRAAALRPRGAQVARCAALGLILGARKAETAKL